LLAVSLGQVLLDRKGIASWKIQLKVGHVSAPCSLVERIDSFWLDSVKIARRTGHCQDKNRQNLALAR
jgi:hypothetical protein